MDLEPDGRTESRKMNQKKDHSEQKNSGKETVQALDRGLKILDILTESELSLGVNELAKKLGISPSAAFRTLKTLEADGWVYQCEDDKYIPGEKLFYAKAGDHLLTALKEVSYAVMREISEKERLPMNLAVREGHRFFVLQQSRSGRYVDFVAPIGSPLPVHASAGGKILLSELPEILRDDILDRTVFEAMTSRTIIRRDAFLEELERVREQRYALDFFESLDYTCCIGVPVRGSDGKILAALSISGIAGVEKEEDLLKYLPLLEAAAEKITERIFMF